MTRLQQLTEHGQAVWFDFIRRSFIAAGGLQELVDDGVRGVTSNPAIFEKAIAGSSDYDEDLARWIRIGASPRGGLALDRGARAHAWLDGRDYTTPDDVRAVAHNCLRHRIILSYEARAEDLTADDVVSEVIRQVAVP